MSREDRRRVSSSEGRITSSDVSRVVPADEGLAAGGIFGGTGFSRLKSNKGRVLRSGVMMAGSGTVVGFVRLSERSRNSVS
jgi:hypothetical protein